MATNLNIIYPLLEQDIIRNLVTLKMLNHYYEHMSFELQKNGNDWALLSLLPAKVSEWDRKAYPDIDYIAFIDGNCIDLKIKMIDKLKSYSVVLKIDCEVFNKIIKPYMIAKKLDSFHSYTTSTGFILQKTSIQIMKSNKYNDDAWKLLSKNGYEADELSRYFENNSQWFGVNVNNQLASICFIFQNYKQIWEIGGVYTKEEYRQKGYGKAVVLAALEYILNNNLVPRYQVKWNNTNSINLAKAIGLIDFLRVDHYLLNAT